MRRIALVLWTVFLLHFCIPALAQGTDGELLTISLLGDCSIGDSFKVRTYQESYATAIKKNGLEWPFSLVRSVLDADDVTVANLEVVFTTKRRQADKSTNLIAAPENAQALLYSGVEVLNTANNHSYDFNDVGYWQSMETLDGLGIAHFGSPDPNGNEIEDKLLVYEVKGIKIGFVGFSYPDARDVGLIADRIKLLREQGCSLVIASLHWGRELQTVPASGQYDYAKKILDAGADVLYGHHPHVLQPVHFYNGKPVFYSLGNFTFGAIGTADRLSGIFQLQYRLTEDGPVLQNFSVVPTSYYGSKDYRAYLLTDEAAKLSVYKRLVFKKETEGMQNLPAFFAQTGSVDFVNGEMVP